MSATIFPAIIENMHSNCTSADRMTSTAPASKEYDVGHRSSHHFLGGLGSTSGAVHNFHFFFLHLNISIVVPRYQPGTGRNRPTRLTDHVVIISDACALQVSMKPRKYTGINALWAHVPYSSDESMSQFILAFVEACKLNQIRFA